MSGVGAEGGANSSGGSSKGGEIAAHAGSGGVARAGAGGASAGQSGGSVRKIDDNHDALADDLGSWVDANQDGVVDSIDINHDGIPDGPGVDVNRDGVVDALALDTDCDGVYDSLDINGDGLADLQTALVTITVPASCHPSNPVSGGKGGAGAMGDGAGLAGSAGGAAGLGGAAGSISFGGSAGSTGGAGGSPSAGTGGAANVNSELGKGVFQGSGDTSARYAEADVYRNGVGYKFMANGQGMNWASHSISWLGTSFTVESLDGNPGSDGSPAGSPSVFCGLYTNKQSDACGLPITIASANSIKTGWRWKANGNSGQYSAGWEIWLGEAGALMSSVRVWLRDPPGQQPVGEAALAGATISGLPGTWNLWKGEVAGIPIVTYTQAEGLDLSELEFDVLDVYRDALAKNSNLTGSQLLAVAAGYQVWKGPLANLVTDDFYVDVR